jgi:hypothetical protein
MARNGLYLYPVESIINWPPGSVSVIQIYESADPRIRKKYLRFRNAGLSEKNFKYMIDTRAS